VSGTEATVFGLDVCAERPLSFLQTAKARPTGRRLEVSMPTGVEGPDWPTTTELISDQRHPDGAVSFQIERSAAGYRIWGPEYGTSLLSADGGRLWGEPGSGGIAAWQRMLIAQALPFAAVLHGLEVLHASAVEVGGGAVAFVGHSGAGKTSLALALCRRGAAFLADDVLALERVGEELVGHPGAPVAGIDHTEAERLRCVERDEEYEVLDLNLRERVARVAVGAQPAPLHSLFFLERRHDGPAAPRFEPSADAQMLLAATFNLVLADARRLAGLLDVCALAAAGRVERIFAGPEVDATELSAAVERRIGASP
jgi:HPr Serine kinase C-terminal domain